MRIELGNNIEGSWGKAGKDFKDGDRVKILNAGQIIEGKFGEQYVFKVMTKDRQEFNLAFNRTSRNNLGRGYGVETEEWAGKVARCFVVKQMVGEGLKQVLYLAPDGWEMNDEGEFYDPNENPDKAIDNAFDRNSKEEIGPEDVPF